MNFEIENNGEASSAFIQRNIKSFKEACNYISNIPYRRNLNKRDILCVLNDNYGTCSTKHAILRKLALENNHPEIKLILGIFKMDAEYAPKIELTLNEHSLDYIPEAHNYLKIGNQYLDFTNSNSNNADFNDKLIEEYEIEYHQINEYKIQLHKQFLSKWIENNSNYNLDEIWSIREQCIKDISEE